MVFLAIPQEKLESKKLLTPYDIECIIDEPEKMEPVARAMGAVNLENLFKAMQDVKVNPTAKIEFQKMLNKLGKLEPDTKADNQSGGPQVVINITRAKDRDDAITIEGQALDDAT